MVLLLDEIDKAEPDLPNGLLETLGQYQFTAPYIDRASNPISADPKRLLVIITTNEERELPKAFVRRCFVHTLTMEEAPEKRLSWLIDRGRLHFKTQITDEAYSKAAELLWQDRDDTPHHQYPPGLAEYIDLLTAISVLPPDEQLPRLDKIAQYALKKELLD